MITSHAANLSRATNLERLLLYFNATLICLYIKSRGLDNTLLFPGNAILAKDKLAKECFTEGRTSRDKYM